MANFKEVLVRPHWAISILIWLRIYPARQSLYSSIFNGEKKLIEIKLFDSKDVDNDSKEYHWVAGVYLSPEQARDEAARLIMLCDQADEWRT